MIGLMIRSRSLHVDTKNKAREEGKKKHHIWKKLKKILSLFLGHDKHKDKIINILLCLRLYHKNTTSVNYSADLELDYQEMLALLTARRRPGSHEQRAKSLSRHCRPGRKCASKSYFNPIFVALLQTVKRRWRNHAKILVEYKDRMTCASGTKKRR